MAKKRRATRTPKKIIETQKCSICKVSKPVASFFRDKRNATHYRYDCKDCHYNRIEKRILTKHGIRSLQS